MVNERSLFNFSISWIPARFGFAMIRNYLSPEKVAEMLITNVLPDHS